MQFSAVDFPLVFGNNIRIFLFDIRIIKNNLVDLFCPDFSGDRIFHAIDLRVDLCIYGCIFKRQIGIQQPAVFHLQIIHIAHALLTLDRTVDQCDIFCMQKMSH